MSGAPAWIDLARRSTAAAGLQNGAGGPPTEEGSHRGENDNAGTAPSFGLSAGDHGAALLPHAAPRRRRLGPTVALILSAAAHAAAFAWLAGTLDVEGLEPASDGVAVEIVFDLHEAEASVGNDDAATAEAGPAAVEPTVAEAVQPVEAETAEPAPPAEIAATTEADSVAPAGQDSAEAVQPDVAGQTPAQDKETVQPASSDAADPVQEADRPDAIEPSAADATAAVQPVASAVPAEAAPTAPDAVEAVSSADRPAEVVVDRAEPAVAVEPETLQPAAPEVATSEPTLPAAPAFEPPAPDAATVALLATPPVTGSALQDTEDASLPEAVTQVPAPRPEPQAAVTKPTPLRTARKDAHARTVEPDPATAGVPPAPRKQNREAKAAAASGGRPVDAAAARKPAAAGSAGSQARSAAAPGAEVTFGRRVLSHVQRYKRYPDAARRAGISGVTRLSITIDRSGGLAGARISAGSGHAILDQEALAVARRAEPYPRPPEGVGGRTFSFAVTLRFTR